MQIAVCVKQVPDIAAVGINPATHTLDRAGAGAEINPLDLHAIEAAVRLAESLDAPGAEARTVALSMGPQAAQAVLRQALGQGVRRAVHLCDRRFAGSDTWATAEVLAAAVRKSGAELVLCGQHATDGDTGQVGPELAARLGWAHISGVDHFAHLAADHLILERRLETGRQALRVTLPAVLSVLRPVSEPRLPGLADKLRARAASIEVWDAQALGLAESAIGFSGSPTRVKRVYPPAPRTEARMIAVPSLAGQIAWLAQEIRRAIPGADAPDAKNETASAPERQG